MGRSPEVVVEDVGGPPDIDATLAAIERAGGTIEIPRPDVFGYPNSPTLVTRTAT